MKLNKFIPSLGLTFIIALGPSHVFAQSGYGYGTAPGTGSSTGMTTVDEIGTMQSSTTSSDCITVGKMGKLCGARAANYCNDHTSARECKSFRSGMNSTSTGSSSSDSMHSGTDSSTTPTGPTNTP